MSSRAQQQEQRYRRDIVEIATHLSRVSLHEDTLISPKVCDPQSDEALDTLITLTQTSSGWTEGDARYLTNKVDKLQQAGTWPRRLDGEPKSWERFCTEVLGYDAGYYVAIKAGITVLEQHGETAPTVGAALTAVQQEAQQEKATQRPPGNPTGHNQHTQGTVDNIHSSSENERPSGTSRAQALRRLRQQRPDLHERVLAGDLSPHKAMVQAGFRTQTRSVQFTPPTLAKAIKKHLSPEDIETLCALLHA